MLTPLGRFGVFAGRSEGHDNAGGDIFLVLGKVEAELNIDYFLTNAGVYVYAADLAAELE